MALCSKDDIISRTGRVFYMNAMYLVLGLLGVLVCAALNAPFGAKDEPRFKQCGLGGAVATDSAGMCVDISGDDEKLELNQRLYDISLAVSIMNGVLLLWSILNHGIIARMPFGIDKHFMLQSIFALTNVGLFAGVVGNMNTIDHDDLLSEANVEKNLYFQDYNPFYAAVSGVVIATIDLIVGFLLTRVVFKEECKAE